MKFDTTRATKAPMMAIAYGLMMAIASGPVGAQELEREFIDPAGVFTQVVTVADRGGSWRQDDLRVRTGR